MISWIQRTFQQHFRAMFGVLLVVTIISFIFTIGASPGIGRAGPEVRSQSFFGHDLSRVGANESFGNDAALSVYLQAGFMPRDSGQIQEYAYQRIAALALADQLKIPVPTDEDLKKHITTLGAFAGPDGQFDANRYASYRDSLRANARVSEGDIARVLKDDIRVMRLQEVLVGPGYVLPSEVRTQLALADSSWTISVATVDYSTFKPEIPVSEDALKRFFDEASFRYTIPPSVGVDYVEFPSAAYLSAVTVNPAEVRAFYDENSARFPRPDAAKNPADAAKPANPDADFAAVQPQVEQALKLEKAQRLALKVAADLTVSVYEQKLKPGSPALREVLDKDHVTLKSAKPFHRDAVPPELNWSEQVVENALALTADRSVSDALPSANGGIVLFWRETLPSRQPALAEVHDRVAADFRELERRKRFAELGRTVHAELQDRVKAGASLEQAAAAVGQLKLTVKDFPPFTRREPPKDFPASARGVLDQLDKGAVSELMASEENGIFVYVKDKKLPDLSESSPLFAATQAQLARLTVSNDRSLFLSEIVAQELKTNAPGLTR
jgi:peptidyl-prolyl cis-trans isomerase D